MTQEKLEQRAQELADSFINMPPDRAIGPMLGMLKNGPIVWHKDETSLVKAARTELTKEISEFARAELQKAAEIAENMPRSWDIDAPDPQHRIAAAIRKLME